MTVRPLSVTTLSARQARLLLLHGQGLLDDCSAPCGPAAVRKVIQSLGYVQLDSINVVERAHHLTLFARRRGYRREHLDQLYTRRHIFEGWTHDASVLPMEWFGRWNHRRERFFDKGWGARWVRNRIGPDADKVFATVLERIRREGPLRSADFEHDEKQFGPRGQSAWWGWKPAKAALEYLWWRGDLCVIARPHFQKVYELSERVVPAEHQQPPCSREEFVAWAAREAIERLNVATATEVAGFFGAISVAEVRGALEAMARAGEVERVLVQPSRDGKPVASYAVGNWKRRLSRAEKALEERNGSKGDPRLPPRRGAERERAMSGKDARRGADERRGAERERAMSGKGARRGAGRPKAERRESHSMPSADYRNGAEARHVRLLSPFDPIARDRRRLLRLFDFDYRFEAFTPGHKRVHGYYVLPILAGERFIGRADLKHDRREGVLQVKGLWRERKAPKMSDEIEAELDRLAKFIGADRVRRR